MWMKHGDCNLGVTELKKQPEKPAPAPGPGIIQYGPISSNLLVSYCNSFNHTPQRRRLSSRLPKT